jgi:galactose mutarotase-like enzyme
VSAQARLLPDQVDGYGAFTLRGARGGIEATFIPGLGMVCCSLREDGQQLLALRGGSAAYADRGSSFGIPLLHPWANRLSGWSYDAGGRHVAIDPGSPVAHRDAGTGLPMHGLLTASRYWNVVDAASAGDVAELSAELDFAAHPALLAGFPFPHRLELHVSVRATRLSIRLALTPSGSDPVPISFGFHPYLRLPGSDRRTWAVELPVRRRAVLDGRGIPTGELALLEFGALSGQLGDRALDDSFEELEAPRPGRPVTFSVADDNRRMSLEFVTGYTVAHVFAPSGSDFICFEPMTAPVDALTSGRGLPWVDPGSTFTAEFALNVTAS